MAQYAEGKKAIGSCDRCSFEYKLSELIPEVVAMKRTGYLVCESCFDIDNPQSFPERAPFRRNDVLRHVAPDEGLGESRSLTVTLEDKTVSFVASSTNTISSYFSSSVTTTEFKTSDYAYPSVRYYRALVRTTNSQFDSLCDDAGITGLGFNLVVSSAVLRVGANILGQQYTNYPTVNNGAYRVIEEYDPTTVTWNSFGSGGSPGTNYTTDGGVLGERGSYYMDWDLTEMVKGWLSGENSNFGIFFPDMSNQPLVNRTDSGNVVWTITAKRSLF